MRRVYLPTTLDELWSIMDGEPNAGIFAGGTDFLVKLRRGEIAVDGLICIERLTEIQGVREERDEILVGAGTTHAELLESGVIHRHLPVLVQALQILASPPIRHMGTIGGNIVNASPAGDTLPPLYVLGAFLEIRSREKTRIVPIDQFISGPGQVQMSRQEVLTGIRIPKPKGFGIHHFEKIGRRKSQACAIASMAALVSLSPDGMVDDIRIAWGSVGPTVATCEGAENILRESPLRPEILEQAASLVGKTVSPIADVRAGAEYRRVVAGNLLFRLMRYGCNGT
ncbi:MAG: xanthine dehydrogenase family protein subunit M [Pseudomonadota bacterium]